MSTTPDGTYMSENAFTARLGHPLAFVRWIDVPPSRARMLAGIIGFPIITVADGHIVEAVDTDGTRWPEADADEPDCAECGAVWNGDRDRCHLCGTGRPNR
jgi:hypothetical protein